MTYTALGRSAPRVDGRDKVTGAAKYTADVELEGMLWVKSLRCPFPHARVTRLDISRAAALPGVHDALAGDDVRGVLYGRRLQDIPVLAQGVARFAGERVAAVCAESLEVAEEALRLIEVDYEELPAVFDAEEALQADAPILHPNVNAYEGLPAPLEIVTNAYFTKRWDRGDVEAGFAEADVVVERTYTTQRVHQGYLEPHSCIVWIDGEGRVNIWAPNKAPYRVRRNLSQALGLPEEAFLFHPIAIGGDFGAKGSPMDIPLCYFFAKRTGRPIKAVMDYTEELTAANPRHAATVHMKTGAKRDGAIVAHQARVLYNSGGYGGFKPVPDADLPGASSAAGAYRIPNVAIEAHQVYTNTVPCGFMRLPGMVQVLFGVESQVDAIARALGMDPLQVRLKNLIGDNDALPGGEVYEQTRGRETLQAAAEAAGYGASKAAFMGRGMAVNQKDAGEGESYAGVAFDAQGVITLHTSVFDPGTGTYTALRQIAAETLGVAPEDIEVRVWNSDGAPFDTGVGGSRSMRVAGVATHMAAQEAREKLAAVAAELLHWPHESIDIEGRDLVRRDTGDRHPWPELLAVSGSPVTTRVGNRDMSASPVTGFTAQVAEVSVDPETGEVTLLRFTTAHDVGTIVNPLGHQSQIEGGVMTGIGYALMEDLRVEDGRVAAANLGEFKLPTMRDIPELQTVLLRSESGLGPHRLKEIGEGPLAPVAAAIANAVADAIGAPILDLPITAEKVRAALGAAPAAAAGMGASP